MRVCARVCACVRADARERQALEHAWLDTSFYQLAIRALYLGRHALRGLPLSNETLATILYRSLTFESNGRRYLSGTQRKNGYAVFGIAIDGDAAFESNDLIESPEQERVEHVKIKKRTKIKTIFRKLRKNQIGKETENSNANANGSVSVNGESRTLLRRESSGRESTEVSLKNRGYVALPDDLCQSRLLLHVIAFFNSNASHPTLSLEYAFVSFRC